jgi:hypothetical protein
MTLLDHECQRAQFVLQGLLESLRFSLFYVLFYLMLSHSDPLFG